MYSQYVARLGLAVAVFHDVLMQDLTPSFFLASFFLVQQFAVVAVEEDGLQIILIALFDALTEGVVAVGGGLGSGWCW